MPEQLEFFAIPNPCRGVCQANERGFCIGCWRSREERFGWGDMSDGQKREVLRLCRQRRQRQRRQGGTAQAAQPQQPSLF